MNQPNQSPIPGIVEEIQKSLDAATPGPWEVDYAVITSVKVKDELNIIGTHMRRTDAHLIANAPTWIRSLLDERGEDKRIIAALVDSRNNWYEKCQELQQENERITKERDGLQIAYTRRETYWSNQIQQLREELEQVKKERDEFASMYFRIREEQVVEREELKQVNKQRDEYKQQNYELVATNISCYEQVEQLREELEQAKKERDFLVANGNVALQTADGIIQSLRSELAAKDKVFKEVYRDGAKVHSLIDRSIDEEKDKQRALSFLVNIGDTIRSILSQYTEKGGQTDGT